MHGINIDKQKIVGRVKRILGQLVGVEKMIDQNKYCIDIITQTSAIKSAISALEDEMLHSHLSHCLSKTKDPKKLKQMEQEIIRVYKLKRK